MTQYLKHFIVAKGLLEMTYLFICTVNSDKKQIMQLVITRLAQVFIRKPIASVFSL